MPYFAPVDKKPSTACYTKVACAVTFCVFSLVYLLFYQCDVLTAGQHVLSGGQTHYNRFVGAFLITLVLYLLQMAVANYAKLTKSGRNTHCQQSVLNTFCTNVVHQKQENCTIAVQFG